MFRLSLHRPVVSPGPAVNLVPTSAMIMADLAVLTVAVVWGASYPVAKGALTFAPVLILILLRFFITSLVMTVLAWKDLKRIRRTDRVHGVILGCLLFGIFLGETFGVAYTSASNAALIVSLCTLFTPFLDHSVNALSPRQSTQTSALKASRWPPAGVIGGALLSSIGVALLTGGLTAVQPGDGLVLGAAILRAIMVVSTKRLMAPRTLSAAALTALQALTVTCLSLIAIVGTGEDITGVLDAPVSFWMAVGFLSLFCTIAAFFIQNSALRHSSPTRVSLLMGTEPLFGVLLTTLLLHEALSLNTMGGAILIVGGTFCGLLYEARRVSPRQ